MTLNITILTPAVIYQSADYMLFDEKAGQSLAMPSTKVVVLSNFDWTGFITYTGIGRVGSKHTSEIVEEWIQKLDRPSFDEVVGVIESRASPWVASVKPGQRHTFVVAAYVDGSPTATVVSNFQRWQGAESGTVASDFAVSTIVAKRRTEVIVTGIRDAVPRARRRALQRLAKESMENGARVRRAMAAANRDGAQRFPGYISEDCFVYSQDNAGRGHYETMGATRADLPMSMGGPKSKDMIRDLLDKQFGDGKWSLRGMTSVTSQSQSAPPEQCKLISSLETSRAGYRILQLATPDGRRATPRSISADGIIVGEACERWNGPPYPCVWPQHATLEFLAHGGGLGGSARDINDSGLIVGSSESPDRASHACTWNLDEDTQDIGENIARHSQAAALNEMGGIVGWVSIHPTEGGQAHFRPTYWPASGSPVIFDDLAGGWGEAVDINSQGVILARVHEGGDILLSGGAEAWIWQDGQVTKIGKPSSDTASFYPKRITEDGRIVGLAIMRNGQRYGVVRSVDGTWSRLFDPLQGRELTAANRNLLLGGYDSVEHYRIPWVKLGHGEISHLQHFKYHHHHVTIVSDQGWLVGTASADNCCHPVLWLPT